MGILDFITKAQEKLNEAQKRIETTSNEVANKTQEKIDELQKRMETFSLGSLFEKQKQKQTPKPNKEKKQTTKPINAEQQILAQRDKLDMEGIEEYKFIANSTCCEVCAKLNGKHFLVSELKIGVNAPPMHDGCRCSIAAYFDRKEFDDWLDFIANGGTTKEWEAMKNKKQ